MQGRLDHRRLPLRKGRLHRRRGGLSQQKPGVPIWIGGNSALTRRRVAARPTAGTVPGAGDAGWTTPPRCSGLDDLGPAPAPLAGRRAACTTRDRSTCRSPPRPAPAAPRRRSAVADLAAADVTWCSTGVPGPHPTRGGRSSATAPGHRPPVAWPPAPQRPSFWDHASVPATQPMAPRTKPSFWDPPASPTPQPYPERKRPSFWDRASVTRPATVPRTGRLAAARRRIRTAWAEVDQVEHSRHRGTVRMTRRWWRGPSATGGRSRRSAAPDRDERDRDDAGGCSQAGRPRRTGRSGAARTAAAGRS